MESYFIYWPFPPVNGEFPSQRASNAELWYFLWYKPEEAVEHKQANASNLRHHEVFAKLL